MCLRDGRLLNGSIWGDAPKQRASESFHCLPFFIISYPNALNSKALLKYGTRAIWATKGMWVQLPQSQSARSTVGVQPSEVLNGMPASIGFVASRRKIQCLTSEKGNPCFGILRLVFAVCVFI
jgi:hypothetical protein